jgi:hypothetical protein
MAKNNGVKIKTGIYLECPCGSKSAVIQNGESRWFSHCPACGRLVFWASPQLTDRVRAGGKLCPHNPDFKNCKDGISKTSWCEKCRVRTFRPGT